MNPKKYLVIPFESDAAAKDFKAFAEHNGVKLSNLLSSDEYPTKRYNGWPNYETWAVALWMGNDQGNYNYWNETAQEIYNEAEADKSFTKEERATLDLSDRLKEEHELAADDLLSVRTTATVFHDLMSAALSEVHWHYIAEHYIEEVEKETETIE